VIEIDDENKFRQNDRKKRDNSRILPENINDIS